jgi:hypothetical protein
MDTDTWSSLEKAVTHYRSCKTHFDAQENSIRPRETNPFWERARIARESAWEDLLVTGLEAYCRALARKSEADTLLVEKQLELATKQAIASDRMAFWTKGLVVVTGVLIIVSAVVGLYGPLRSTPLPTTVRLEYPSTSVRLPESSTHGSADGP